MTKLTITPAFILVFAAVLFLTLLSGGLSFWLAAQTNLSDQQLTLFDRCTDICLTGFGSIFGLLSAKATDLLSPSSKE